MEWLKGTVFLILVLVLAAIPAVVPVKTFHCLMKFKGEYSGPISVTRTGFTCQRWDTGCPNSRTSKFTDADFPDGSKTAASNYCRNPKSDLEDYPWCYIADPKSPKDWDYCHIPFCTKGTECRITTKAAEYMGTYSVATHTDGKQYPCQRWDSQSPNTHSRQAGGFDFNEDTLKEVENYCRNPKGSENKTWCYTTDGGPRWAYCDINPPICATTKICSDPPTVEHAIRLTPTAAGPYDHKTTATYKCTVGYEFADENDGVECLLTGKWSAKPVCVKLKCPPLELAPATVVVDGDPDAYGTTVTYTCDDGSKHTSGDLTRKCQTDKKWSGTAPTCTQIDCGTAPTVPDATLELTTSSILGGVARYKCDKDKLTYEKICNKDGNWVGTICSGTPVGVLVADACTTAVSPAALAGLIVCSLIAFATVLGLSIVICRLKHGASPTFKPAGRPKPSKGYNREKPPSTVDRKLTTARMAERGNHNYYRDLY